jgi:protein-disulfide isomerase
VTNDRQKRAARAEQMRKEREKASRRQRNRITTVVVVAVVALIAAAALGYQQLSKDDDKPLVAPANATDDFAIPFTTEVSTGKPATDPVTVTLYEDFQCPGCQALEAGAGTDMKKAVDAGQVTIEYRPVSFLNNASTTDYSTRATNAALCVLDEKGVKAFYDMHQLLYANQPAEGGEGLPDDTLAEMAQNAGASDKVSSCIEDGRFEPWIEDATNAWRDAGYGGTPTVVVDGKEVTGESGGQQVIPSWADIQKAVTAARQG